MTAELRDQLQSTLGSAYTLERELGGGGMSRVFVATDTALGRKVVVKVLPSELAAGVNTGRFKREIQLAAQLQHPHIVPVLTAGDTDGLPFYTMPLVEGESLRARLARAGELPIPEAARILRDIAKALAYAHRHGVVHRDIKPENILISDETALVTDFGVAKALASSSGSDGAITTLGVALGTPAYMAPEQAAADPHADHRADIYSFGALAYELLSGRPPFAARSPQAMLAAHIAEQPQPVEQLRPTVPPVLAGLVMRCLQKHSADRPQNAGELLHELESLTTPSGGTMPSLTPWHVSGTTQRVSARRAIGLYLVAFLLVVALAKLASLTLDVPDWVLPGASVVMLLGAPVIALTLLVQHAPGQSAAEGVTATPVSTAHARATTTRLVAFLPRRLFTLRRTVLGGVAAVALFLLLIVGYTVLRTLGIGAVGSLLATGALKENARLLVADFHIGGPDSGLGTALAEAVRTSLGDSRRVSLVPSTTVSAALQRMQRPDTTALDLAVSRELAQREAIPAIVAGEAIRAGGKYAVTLRLLAATTGEELTALRASSVGESQLIAVVGNLTRRLRGKIGESLKLVRSAPSLERVTTSSLDALKKYAAGARANDIEGDYAKSISLLQDAVTLDTNFAIAYRKLANSLRNAGIQAVRVAELEEKAYRFRDRLTERERLLATGSYFNYRPRRDRQRAMSAYENLLEIDPNDLYGLHFSGDNFLSRREFDRAREMFARERDSIPDVSFGYYRIGYAQVHLGRFADARASAAGARQRFPNAPEAVNLEVYILSNEGRLDSLQRVLQGFREAPDAVRRIRASGFLSSLALARGQLESARRITAELRAANAARGESPPRLTDSLNAAQVEIWYREARVRGAQILDAALTREPLREQVVWQRPYFRVASLYAMADRPDRARAILSQYDAEVIDTALRRQDEPARHATLAELALADRRWNDAITEFKLADVLPDGPATECSICLHVNLGRAYDLAENADSAIAAFERYVATPYSSRIEQDQWYLAGVHKRLGELHEAKGDRARAAYHFAEFIEIWKNADAELQPKVAEVRARLARLKDTEKR